MFAPAAASLQSTWYTGANSIDITLKAHIYRPFSAAGFLLSYSGRETYHCCPGIYHLVKVYIVFILGGFISSKSYNKSLYICEKML